MAFMVFWEKLDINPLTVHVWGGEHSNGVTRILSGFAGKPLEELIRYETLQQYDHYFNNMIEGFGFERSRKQYSASTGMPIPMPSTIEIASFQTKPIECMSW